MLNNILRSKSSSLVLAVWLAMACGPAAFAADSYSVKRLTTGQGGSAFAHAINKAGQVAGGAGAPHAASAVGELWTGGVNRDINAMGRSDYINALGLNNNQQVVGSTNTDTSLRAFTWTAQNGTQLLPVLAGDNNSEAFSINDAGTIAGYSGGASGLRAVLWTSAGVTNLGILPGGDHSQAVAVNSTGDAVGFSNSSAGSHAILWATGSAMRDLGMLPGDTSSSAADINDTCQVVGSSQTEASSHAFFWTETSGMLDLGALAGGERSDAKGINNASQVVGSSDSSLGQRAFVWTAADGMRDLNTLIPGKSNLILIDAVAINDAGQIVALGSVGHDLENDRKVEIDASMHAGPTDIFLLTPKK